MKSKYMGISAQPFIRFRKMINAGTIIFVLSVICDLIFTLAYASEGGGESHVRNWSDFGWRAFNFAVLAGFLYWLLAGKVKDFFTGRRRDVKASLEEATAAKEEAKRKFAEYDAKLNKAQEELKDMAEMIRAQGLAEKGKILADAARAAEKMKEDARKRMDQEMKAARNELKAEAARLAVKMAEEILKKEITATDHAGMVGEYIDKVVRH